MEAGRLIEVEGKFRAGWASAMAKCCASERASLLFLAWRAEAWLWRREEGVVKSGTMGVPREERCQII